jgi:hypothetical protein
MRTAEAQRRKEEGEKEGMGGRNEERNFVNFMTPSLLCIFRRSSPFIPFFSSLSLLSLCVSASLRFFLLYTIITMAGCAKAPPKPAAIVYPYRADAQKVFYATDSGLSEMTYQGETAEALPASRAPNASVLGSDGKTIAVAVNGWGVEAIEASPDGKSYRLVDSPLPAAFQGLATGAIWPLGGGFLVQLFRDPFLGPEARPAAPGSSSRLVFLGGVGREATFPDPIGSGAEAGFELFALLPAGGAWFAELRKDGPDRVELKFFSFGDPLAGPKAGSPPPLAVRRSEFEAALTPLPLSRLEGEAGSSLRSALAALGRDRKSVV